MASRLGTRLSKCIDAGNLGRIIIVASLLIGLAPALVEEHVLGDSGPVGTTVSLSPTSGPVRASVQISGTNFKPNVEVRLLINDCNTYFTGSASSQMILNLSGVADNNGSVQTSMLVPVGLSPGCYTFHLESRRDPGVFWTETSFRVTGSPSTNVTPTSSPITPVPNNPESPVNPGPCADTGSFLGATASCGSRPTQPNPPSTSSPTGPTGTYPSAPGSVVVTPNTPSNQVCVQWNGIDGANKYNVYDGNGNFLDNAAVANTAKCFQTGIATCFMVSAVTNDGETAKSAPACMGGSSQPPTQPVSTGSPGASSAPMCQSYCPVTPDPNSFVCVGGIPGLCNLPPPSPHHYIIFLDGINSHADASGDYAYLNYDFESIKSTLRQVGFHDNQFVSFSYSAARRFAEGGSVCEGWDNACTGAGRGFESFSNINASPVYVTDDTKIDLTKQADILHGLILSVVLHDNDPSTTVDLVGYSLGGIVASYWAATNDKMTGSGQFVHSLILLESPVGGIYPATAVLQGGFVGSVWDAMAKGNFGTTVLTQLQVPIDGVAGSIVGQLSQAAVNYPVTSIESSTDYLVSGKIVGPTIFGGVPIAIGADFWPGVTLHTADLSNDTLPWEPSPLTVLSHHGAPLYNGQVGVWIAQSVLAP